MRLRFFMVLLLLSLLTMSISFVTQAQSETSVYTLTHDEVERTYRLYVPEAGADKLLIVLHPAGSSGYAMQIMSDLNAAADTYGFAVAYPNAVNLYWNAARSGIIPPDDGSADDIDFLATLSDTIASEHDISPDAVYLAGMRNGAEMAFIAACTMPEQYAGIITIAALMWSYQVDACAETEASTPINTLIIWGDSDHFYFGEEYNINFAAGTQTVLSTEGTLDFWATRNACDMANMSNPIENVTQYTCDADTTTAFVTIAGGGNAWYRMANHQLNQMGIDYTELVAEFVVQSESWLDAARQSTRQTEPARSWLLYVPTTYDANTPMPIVVLLHGRTADGESQAWASDFNRIAEREGIIALYPEGIELEWNYTRPIESDAGANLPDDEAFLAMLLDDLALDLNIDSERVYVTGLSNGGFMAQRVACSMQDRFAAFASVAATGAFRLPDICAEKEAMPAMYIHGTADSIVPWDGMSTSNEAGEEVLISASMSQTIGFWAGHNACGADLDIVDIARVNDETQTRILNVTECLENAPVVIYMVVNGGHTWHGVRGNSEFLGYSSQDFNASEVIWEFFSQFPLN